jgi:hypothetical protein
MVLAYGAARGTASPYLQAMLKRYTLSRALNSLYWHPNGGTSFPLKPGQQSRDLRLTLDFFPTLLALTLQIATLLMKIY